MLMFINYCIVELFTTATIPHIPSMPVQRQISFYFSYSRVLRLQISAFPAHLVTRLCHYFRCHLHTGT